MSKISLKEELLQTKYCCDVLQQFTKNKEVKNFLANKSLSEIMTFKKEVENFVFNDDKIEKKQIKDLFNLDLEKLTKYFHISNNESIEFNYGVQGIHVVNKALSNVLSERANIRKDKESYIYKIDCFNCKKQLIFDKDLGRYDAKSISLALLAKINNEYNEDLDIGPKDIHYLKDGQEIPLKVNKKKIELFSRMGNGCSRERHFIELWTILFGKKRCENPTLARQYL
jgi:hypothetical protein